MSVLHPFDRPHARRASAVRSAAAAVGADAGHYHMLVRGRDHIVRFHGLGGVDASVAAEARWRDAEGLAILLGDADPDHVAPLNALASPPEDLYAGALWRFGFAEVGYHRAVHGTVTDGAAVRGQVSLLRTSPAPWSAPERLLEQVSKGVCDAFRQSWEEEAALAAPEGAAAIRADGTVVADEPVAEWIAQHDAATWLARRAPADMRRDTTHIGRSDRAWVPGAFAQWRPIPGGGMLVSFEPVTPMVLPPVVACLTPMQRRVASLAAAGATAAEIARELDRSPETVREHLTRIYQRLGLASRSELASACRRMMV